MASWLAIGKVRSSFGLKGDLKVLSFSGVYDHFENLKVVNLRRQAKNKDMKVESFRWAGETPLLKFAGVDDPETAKELADWEIWAEREHAAPLKDGEYYLVDLIGCHLIVDDRRVGEVLGFLEGGVVPLLEVKKIDENVVIVPFQERYLGKIDLEVKEIELKTEWILE